MTEKGPVMSDEIERLYGHAIKLHELEPHYCRHVQAMTAEGLHGKSDIAAELAWRDRRIDKLKADVGTMLELLANRDKDFASLQAERDALRVSLDDKVAEYTLGRVAWRVWNERIATERDAALARVEALEALLEEALGRGMHDHRCGLVRHAGSPCTCLLGRIRKALAAPPIDAALGGKG